MNILGNVTTEQVSICMTLVIIGLLTIVSVIRNNKARNYVLKNKSNLADLFATARSLAGQPYAIAAFGEPFEDLFDSFSDQILPLTENSWNVDWIKAKQDFDQLKLDVNRMILAMRCDIQVIDECLKMILELQTKIRDLFREIVEGVNNGTIQEDIARERVSTAREMRRQLVQGMVKSSPDQTLFLVALQEIQAELQKVTPISVTLAA